MKRLFTIVLLLLVMASLGSLLLANTADDFSLSWVTVDGGGGMSQGGPYRASITIGQADTSVMAGGDYTLRGGFWVFGPLEWSLYLPFLSRP